MKRLALVLGGLGVLAFAAMELPAGETTKPTIKQLMKKLNSGPESLLPRIAKAIKSQEPDWQNIQQNSKQLAELAAGLSELTPPLGDKESWDRLARAYVDNAKTLDIAAKKKDRPGARAAHAKLGGSCKACHDAHRPKTSGF